MPTGRGSTAHRAPDAPAGDKSNDKSASGATAAGGAAAAAGAAGAAGAAATAGKTDDKPADATARKGADEPSDAPAGSDKAGKSADADGKDGSLGKTAAAAAGGAGVAGMAAAAFSGDKDSSDQRGATQATADQQRDLERKPGADLDRDRSTAPASEKSGAAQWLILIAQVLASAVAGAALFIGFQLLWDDLPWVALALAIIVIVGLVAMVRVLRRSNDTVSIALAVIVGLGVTCGPLLLKVIT